MKTAWPLSSNDIVRSTRKVTARQVSSRFWFAYFACLAGFVVTHFEDDFLGLALLVAEAAWLVKCLS